MKKQSEGRAESERAPGGRCRLKGYRPCGRTLSDGVEADELKPKSPSNFGMLPREL
jgi:hypothetical protein